MPDITAARPVSGAPVASAWGGQVHDLIEGLQAGVVSMPSAVAGNAQTTITFPRAYVGNPVVVASGPGAASYFMVQVGVITPTTVQLLVRDIRDAQAGTGPTTVTWIAVGTPA